MRRESPLTEMKPAQCRSGRLVAPSRESLRVIRHRAYAYVERAVQYAVFAGLQRLNVRELTQGIGSGNLIRL